MARTKSSPNGKDSSANLGFEAKLWLNADKLRTCEVSCVTGGDAGPPSEDLLK